MPASLPQDGALAPLPPPPQPPRQETMAAACTRPSWHCSFFVRFFIYSPLFLFFLSLCFVFFSYLFSFPNGSLGSDATVSGRGRRELSSAAVRSGLPAVAEVCERHERHSPGSTRQGNRGAASLCCPHKPAGAPLPRTNTCRAALVKQAQQGF